MNNNFTTSSPFQHLQHSSDGTGILRNTWRHTNEGLGCKERGYKRKRVSQKKGEHFFYEIENKKVNSALSGIELKQYI